MTTALTTLQLLFAGCTCSATQARLQRHISETAHLSLTAITGDVSSSTALSVSGWRGTAADNYRDEVQTLANTVGTLESDVRGLCTLALAGGVQ